MIVDADSHIYELATMWEDHIDPAKRHLALRIEPDDLGYSHLTYRGEALQMVVPTVPDRTELSGQVRQRRAAGLPAETGLYDLVPRDYWDIGARTASLATWGIDRAVAHPQFQGIMDSAVDDVEGVLANMEAWNRWAASVVDESAGRLLPVGHLRVRDELDWVVDQVGRLGAAGVPMALFVPGLMDGKPPSHPDNDRVWSAFEDAGVSPVWHVSGAHRHAIADVASWEPVVGGGFGLATAMFLRVASLLALSDMVFHGVFERHPGLSVVVAELGVDWLEPFTQEMDLRLEILTKQRGRAEDCLTRRPSEYVRDHLVIVASCPTPADVVALGTPAADHCAFGSDYPHGCGFADPLHGYRAHVGDALGTGADDFYGGRIARLLDRGTS